MQWVGAYLALHSRLLCCRYYCFLYSESLFALSIIMGVLLFLVLTVSPSAHRLRLVSWAALVGCAKTTNRVWVYIYNIYIYYDDLISSIPWHAHSHYCFRPLRLLFFSPSCSTPSRVSFSSLVFSSPFFAFLYSLSLILSLFHSWIFSYTISFFFPLFFPFASNSLRFVCVCLIARAFPSNGGSLSAWFPPCPTQTGSALPPTSCTWH